MIALIAGTGALPAELVARLRDRGEVPVICALRGFAPEVPEGLPRIEFRLETLGSMLRSLSAMGVTRICMAGAIRRPLIDPSAIDTETQPLVPEIMTALTQGDDGALRAVIGILERQGFEVVSAQSLAPDLLPEAGVLTTTAPGPSHTADAATAEAVVAQMSRADQGQACIVRAGSVLAREDEAGTNAMLSRLQAPPAPSASDPLSWMMDTASDMIGGAADWLSGAQADTPGHGAILFKAAKPDQDLRADLPVIGPETADRVVALGLDGIVIEAGSVMVLGQDRVIQRLEAAGKFLWVRPRGGAG